MMRIISANLNGIRAAARKGFFEWMLAQEADVVCLQETKAQVAQLTDAVFMPAGYHVAFHDAVKKGYSGTAIYSRSAPHHIQTGLGFDLADSEGRYVQFDFEKLSVGSIYFPSGTSGEERQALKYDFMARYEKILQQQLKMDREFVICGDWNIAHHEIDLKNWKGNQKNSGFLPEERAWLDKLFSELGYVDAFRVLNQEADQYTWWSNRGQAYAKNVGWRIDYQVVTPGLAKKLLRTEIYKETRFSDHAPLIMDYDIKP